MSRAFMYGTGLQELEQIMMSVPNFLPRRKGIVIMAIQTVDEHEKFKDCICYDHHIKYEDFINDCFKDFHHYYLNKRLRQLVGNFHGDWFLNHEHKNRFEQVCKTQGISMMYRNQYHLAILYLLTANDVLWSKTKDHIYLNHVDFSKVRLNGIDTDGYALFQMAKTIATRKKSISINEISDEQLMGNFAFKAIANAILIARYGGDVLTIGR